MKGFENVFLALTNSEPFGQHSVLGVKKSSLFPLTSPKKIGTVGRHNFFFLINFFFFFQRKLLIFILQTCSFLFFFILTGSKSKLNTIILMNCQQNCNK